MTHVKAFSLQPNSSFPRSTTILLYFSTTTFFQSQHTLYDDTHWSVQWSALIGHHSYVTVLTNEKHFLLLGHLSKRSLRCAFNWSALLHGCAD